jgi:glycosyltransferase involved in cell wall biosynthesis
MRPLVSILIPAFNAEEWIAETIESALKQTWDQKEIIVVNDGSTDRTLEVAQRYEAKRVCVTTQPNQGAAAARNRAYTLSRGDYIQWLDADDLLAPDKIARQVLALERGLSRRTLLSSAWGRFFYRCDRAAFMPSGLWRDYAPLEWLLYKLDRGLPMPNMTWLVSRELAEAAGPWDTRLSLDDDGEYFCRVVLASDDIRFVPEAKAYYRNTGSSSLSHSGGSNRKLESLLLSIQLHIGYLRALEDSQRVRAACLSYLSICLPFVYPEHPEFVRRLQDLAAGLGGELKTPGLSWKYAWIQKLFGWGAAKRAQAGYNAVKATTAKALEKALFKLAGQGRIPDGVAL